MKVLILGLGVIGTTYGYAFQKAGYHIEHFIRDEKKQISPKRLQINILDGRKHKKGIEYTDEYNVRVCEDGSSFDFIFVSVSSGHLKQAINSLRNKKIKGTVVLFCNFWETKAEIAEMMKGFSYIIGFPVAGGNIVKNTLNTVIFDSIMLEKKEKSKIDNYNKLEKLLKDALIKTEKPYDMVEWIWIHMAINAGVTSTAGKKGDLSDPKKLANELMGSSKLLQEAILSIRETLKIVKARGVNLKKYKGELFAFKIERHVASFLMKKLFKKNELTRRIMTLHNDVNDILYGTRSVFETGKALNVKAPRFYQNMEVILNSMV